jgi:hypothetical protein
MLGRFPTSLCADHAVSFVKGAEPGADSIRFIGEQIRDSRSDLPATDGRHNSASLHKYE